LFERFTERAKQVVVFAQDEAQQFKHNYIGTEHLLLGLLRVEDGLAARVLGSLGVTLDEVRAQVARIIGYGEVSPSGQVPFTPRAKKVLELSLREAMALGHNYIGTEHILLGIVRENEGVAAQVLGDFDANAEKIRDRVKGMLLGPRPRDPEKLREQIERVREDKERAIETKQFERAAGLRNAERLLTAELREEPPRPIPRPPHLSRYSRDPMHYLPLVPGWLLFAVSMGIGVLVGWAIWGL
jgi:ATP-dependent Clp protease ATP-binding subunit ClpA